MAPCVAGPKIGVVVASVKALAAVAVPDTPTPASGKVVKIKLRVPFCVPGDTGAYVTNSDLDTPGPIPNGKVCPLTEKVPGVINASNTVVLALPLFVSVSVWLAAAPTIWFGNANSVAL
jgi:hypothetical protein